MKENLTHLVFLVDRSGSMYNIRGAMNEAVNGVIAGQKEEKGECTCSLYQFDTQHDLKKRKAVLQIEPTCENTPLEKVPVFDLQPRGGTPLVDAACILIDKTGEHLSRLPESQRPERVVIVLVTDGQENSSEEYTSEQLKERIKHQTDVYSWTFMFLGADQNAIEEAAHYGIHANHSLTFAKTSGGIKKMSQGLSKKIGAMRSMSKISYDANAGSGLHTGYTTQERLEQVEEGANH